MFNVGIWNIGFEYLTVVKMLNNLLLNNKNKDMALLTFEIFQSKLLFIQHNLLK